MRRWLAERGRSGKRRKAREDKGAGVGPTGNWRGIAPAPMAWTTSGVQGDAGEQAVIGWGVTAMRHKHSAAEKSEIDPAVGSVVPGNGSSP